MPDTPARPTKVPAGGEPVSCPHADSAATESSKPVTPVPCRVITPNREATAWCRAVTSLNPTNHFGRAVASSRQSSRSRMRWVPKPPRAHQRTSILGSSQARLKASARSRSVPANQSKSPAPEVPATTLRPQPRSTSRPVANRTGSGTPATETTATEEPGFTAGGASSARPGLRGRSRDDLRTRNPARVSNSISSRELTGTTPAATTRSYHSAGTS